MNFDRISQKELAQAIGFTPRTIRDWKDCPRNPDGSYCLSAVVAWMVSRAEDAADAAADANDDELRRAKVKYWVAKAANEELKADKEMEKLISFADVAIAWGRRMSEVSSGLDMLAYRLPPLIEGRDQDGMRREITAEVQRLKTAYCRRGRFCDYGPVLTTEQTNT